MVHWSDRRPRAGLMGVEMRTPSEGAPPAGLRTSVRDVGGRRGKCFKVMLRTPPPGSMNLGGLTPNPTWPPAELVGRRTLVAWPEVAQTTKVGIRNLNQETRRGPLHTFEVAVLWSQQVRVHLEIKELSGGMPGRAALATTFNVHVVSPRIGDPVFGVSAAAGANRPDL